MTDGIRQFKINGKQVELNDKKSINRDLYVQDAVLNSIFDKLNKADASGNIDDVLDEKEIKEFQQKIIDAAGEDGNLSSEEAKSLLDSMGLKDIDTNKFFGFIQPMFSKDDAKTKEEVSDAIEQPQESDEVEEEQITRGLIVQNGESPAIIAKKFGVPLQDLLDANKDALKGKGNNKYFLVGQEIVIPRKIDDEELATLTADRKSAEETTSDYAQQAAIQEQKRQQREQEEAELKELGMTERANGEVNAHYSKTPDKTIIFKKVANAKNGRSICVDKNGNYVVVAKDGTILKTDFVKNPEKYEEARKRNEEIKTRNTAKGIAKEFYQIADDNSGIDSIRKMQKLLDTKVTSKNITQFLDEYDKFKQGDSSIIDTITSEVGASGSSEQKKVLTTLMDKLSQAARAAGVSESEIKKANADFISAYNVEYKSMNGAFRRTNPKDMEKAMDSLRGNILVKQNGTGDVDSAEAIKQFKDLARDEHNSAVKDFNKAREEEGWTAKVGDTVCGWFGCNTIEDLNKKLGANGATVKKLINSKTEAEFRTNYKEIFGVEFDPNKISARQNAIEKYSFALNCDNTIKTADKVLKHSDSWDYGDMKTAIRNNFKYDNSTIDQIIEGYAQQKGIQNPTDADKKAILVQFLNDTKTNARREFTNIAQGKSLDQMGKDIELITRSAFGTNDIVKDVIQFNENQQITEMVTEAGFEIAGTIALQFVPGLGQMAAARLAVSAARWGTKAVKVVNYAQKAEKVFSTVNKFQKGEAIANATTRTAKAVNRGVQIGSQMVNTGIATAGVDLSNGKSVKETTKKALMNMSFAGVGASSSILAPKLMQAFGIADKALATEIAEEIINAAGSYGVTKLEGGEYSSTDAFVDFASGLIISRISHVGGSKPTNLKPQGATTPEVPTAPKVDTPTTPAPKTKPLKAGAEIKPAEAPEIIVKPNPEAKPDPIIPKHKKEVVVDEVPTTPVKTSYDIPPTPIKVGNGVLTPEAETPVAPQPKYTKEFEPAHNDTPVSPEIIDERLRPDNHELKDMGEYYRELEVETQQNKFGTAEKPDYMAMKQAKTPEDLQAALKIIESLPDSNGLKIPLKLELENKLKSLSIKVKPRTQSINLENLYKKIETDTVGSNGTPRFTEKEQLEIKELCKENPTLVEKLLNDTIIDEYGNTVPRFASYNVIWAAKAYKENPEFFTELYNFKSTNLNGNKVSRFNNDDLWNAFEAYQKNPEYVSKLLYETVDYKGLKLYKYSGYALNEISKQHIPTKNLDLAYNQADKALDGVEMPLVKDSVSYEFLQFLDLTNHEAYKQVIDPNITPTLDNAKLFKKDFEKLKKTEAMSNFIKNFPDNPKSDMLYKKYLDSEFPSTSDTNLLKIKNKCIEINKKYGTKIILPSDLTEANECLGLIEQELHNFKTQSNGKAKLPPVIDFLSSKAQFTVSAEGFSEIASGAVNMKGMHADAIKNTLKHEMTHSNDLKNLMEFPNGVKKLQNGQLNISECKYYDDLKNIGLSDERIEYAYTNPMEFIAVASEGDLSKCSKELKAALIDFGMPEWMLKNTDEAKIITQQQQFGKLGTLEKPNYTAFYSLESLDELNDALSFIEKLPDSDSMKKILKTQVDKKLQKLDVPKSNNTIYKTFSSREEMISQMKAMGFRETGQIEEFCYFTDNLGRKISVNTRQVPFRASAPKADWGKDNLFDDKTDLTLSHKVSFEDIETGFASSKNVPTDVGHLTTSDIAIEGNFHGYIGNTLGVDGDLRSTLVSAGYNRGKSMFSAYHKDKNITIIGLNGVLDHMHRPGVFNILLHGNVSDIHAQGLIAHLENQGLLPRDLGALDSNKKDLLIAKVKEETAKYFNSLK